MGKPQCKFSAQNATYYQPDPPPLLKSLSQALPLDQLWSDSKALFLKLNPCAAIYDEQCNVQSSEPKCPLVHWRPM